MGDKNWQIWMEAARLRTLPAAVAPVLVGSALAGHEGQFDWRPALLCLGFAVLVQIGTNFANDCYDAARGADTADRVGPRRAVAAGLISPAQMRRAMAAVFAAAFCTGLFLLPWGGLWLLAVGAASILCGYAYTAGPYPLGYHGLGDLFVFLFFGLVAVCATYYVQTGAVNLASVMVSLPVGVLAANILVVNNYRDAETDARAGKNTLVVRFGRRFASWQFGFSHALAMVVPVGLWLRGFPATCLLPLAMLPLAVRQAKRLRKAATPGELIALLGDTGLFLAAYALLFSVGLAWRPPV